MTMKMKLELDTLRTIANYRILSVTQITSLLFKNKKAARRRINRLGDMGLLENVGFSRTGGRDETLYSVSPRGASLLREENVLPCKTPNKWITREGVFAVDHQILMNWFHVHLEYVARQFDNMECNVLTENSPFHLKESGDVPVISVPAPDSDDNTKAKSFVPDATFSLTDNKQEKTVLFFLEVDRGTESLDGPEGFAQKIINYKHYFRSERYKYYERICLRELNGFRLLVLTHVAKNEVRISRLVREMSPSSFVWVTSAEKMFEQGLAAKIWSAGGDMNADADTILNAKMKMSKNLVRSIK
ncbi:replication-relaxation family protein [Candidatus Hydrogenedentota bacterium]